MHLCHPFSETTATTHTTIAAQSQTFRLELQFQFRPKCKEIAGCHNYFFQTERRTARSAPLLYIPTLARVRSNYFFHACSIWILKQKQQADLKVFFFTLSHHLLVHSRAKVQNNHLDHRQQGSCHLDSRQCRRPHTRDLLTS